MGLLLRPSNTDVQGLWGDPCKSQKRPLPIVRTEISLCPKKVKDRKGDLVLIKYMLPAIAVFACFVGVALAGAPPCPSDCPTGCKPVRMLLVEAPSCAAEAPSCAGEKSCAGDRGGCHGRSRPSFAERRASRIAGRCAARDARAAARAACCGTAQVVQVVQVAECCEPAACPTGCNKCSNGCPCK